MLKSQHLLYWLILLAYTLWLQFGIKFTINERYVTVHLKIAVYYKFVARSLSPNSSVRSQYDQSLCHFVKSEVLSDPWPQNYQHRYYSQHAMIRISESAPCQRGAWDLSERVSLPLREPGVNKTPSLQSYISGLCSVGSHLHAPFTGSFSLVLVANVFEFYLFIQREDHQHHCESIFQAESRPTAQRTVNYYDSTLGHRRSLVLNA